MGDASPAQRRERRREEPSRWRIGGSRGVALSAEEYETCAVGAASCHPYEFPTFEGSTVCGRWLVGFFVGSATAATAAVAIRRRIGGFSGVGEEYGACSLGVGIREHERWDWWVRTWARPGIHASVTLWMRNTSATHLCDARQLLKVDASTEKQVRPSRIAVEREAVG